MSASYKTVEKVVRIIIEETSPDVAKRIIDRLVHETTDNQSYRETLRRLSEVSYQKVLEINKLC